ncbi:hypothetical protein ASPZODRAFT_20222 [Penicilliopsis zonata CBS 506.65]|uniref:Uncharacterized protein n=1 Tax=Penicilliopsis zonata CBS 506.65 TaxID=1073090 RepID=A0A1L9S6D6_9EURO|nr:hypothetical protein ASPZODRAFT_20222 [Penicilliopsis zonata CBS 506.65]OJJ42695.1 hypothetical protein ASPZODRAFT_20222 [Penicilliopsis zonata CBS 506.65]
MTPMEGDTGQKAIMPKYDRPRRLGEPFAPHNHTRFKTQPNEIRLHFGVDSFPHRLTATLISNAIWTHRDTTAVGLWIRRVMVPMGEGSAVLPVLFTTRSFIQCSQARSSLQQGALQRLRLAWLGSTPLTRRALSGEADPASTSKRRFPSLTQRSLFFCPSPSSDANSSGIVLALGGNGL